VKLNNSLILSVSWCLFLIYIFRVIIDELLYITNEMLLFGNGIYTDIGANSDPAHSILAVPRNQVVSYLENVAHSQFNKAGI
jgi:hypothetical protein